MSACRHAFSRPYFVNRLFLLGVYHSALERRNYAVHEPTKKELLENVNAAPYAQSESPSGYNTSESCSHYFSLFLVFGYTTGSFQCFFMDAILTDTVPNSLYGAAWSSRARFLYIHIDLFHA